MSKQSKKVDIECTSAFMASGKMIKPGQVVRGVPATEAQGLKRRGKAKILEASVDAESDDVDVPGLQDLTVEELKTTAKEYEIEGAEKMKKAELIAAIEAAEAGDE
ncbi:Rho termination factor N-terminal domain-containing protein [Vreelandella janggokensis]|uniref:Rho termination factor N-terminal domain-containing protein n=1 Tax=Vreelandella janggokensis TaxID=370767 RepID=UPI00285C9A33|nr:Rho termination factor N-terminal domain-containing protein [Halomonas janggokensis]MDR5887556.1 Rho termination factor N-terminal domain-containing protein [Halomonas janggokensis]